MKANFYMQTLNALVNALHREPQHHGFWAGIKKRYDATFAEFVNYQDQLHELIERGEADDCAKNEYLDLDAALKQPIWYLR